jgi:hypothetical protein
VTNRGRQDERDIAQIEEMKLKILVGKLERKRPLA